MDRSFIVASASDPRAAADAVAAAWDWPGLCVVSPTEMAKRTASVALAGTWVPTVEEQLFVARHPEESGGDVLARMARALRALCA
jgi:hypothetical protein